MHYNLIKIFAKMQTTTIRKEVSMSEITTFGDFLIDKRLERGISARQLAKDLGISAVYICDFEKNRRPVTDEILKKLVSALALSVHEQEVMYDLAAKSRNTVSADLPEYIMEKDIVRTALRVAKKNNIPDTEWEEFIKKITGG